jgi:sterol desaturase/sphingolipid hydroxylase (fatty acid hydroxylase superfamily)
MTKYFEIFTQSFTDYFNYLVNEIANPSWSNYFYALLFVSLLIWILEIIVPWRQNQKIIRKGFYLDLFYLFFNFFLFSLVGYNAISNVGVELFNDFLAQFGFKNIVAINIDKLPTAVQYILLFLLADFIQWNVHRLLHKNKYLWKFHKVHHSVTEMGFAAHFRFHWLETIVYKSIQYIPMAMIGFSIKDFFIVHMISVIIGHLNHSNLNISYGPLKYILNNPKMHIWHHSKEIPEGKYGVNFGISLSIWDYFFGTDYIPYDGKDIDLGFENVNNYPDSFIDQNIKPFKE